MGKRISLWSTLGAFLAVAGLVLSGTEPSLGAAPDEISVCVAPTDAAGQALYAADLGFFAKHNLAVNLQTMQSSSLAYSATIGGSCTFGYANIAVMETAFAKGLPVTIVAAAGTSDYAHGGRVGYVMVRNGLDISSPKDLEGRIVAESDLHSVSWLATVEWLDQNGADSTKVKFVEVPFPAMAPALQQGRIDAAMLIEPFASQARPVAKVFGADPYQSISKKDLLGGSYFALKTYADTHRDVVVRFAQAIREAGDWANKHQPESAQILSKYTSVGIAQINAFPRLPYAGRLDPAMIQPTIDALAKYKVIEKAYNANDLIWR
jgi:NitT/TauT family transport system substrate-binding protein